MEIARETGWLAGVPVLWVYPQGGNRLPLLLAMHGFRGCKEDLAGVAERFAQLGYCVVSIDAHLHGAAGAQPFVASSIAPRLEEVLAVTAGWTENLIAAAGATGRADPARAGWLGVSLGGAVLFRYLERCAAAGQPPALRGGAALIAGMGSFWPETLRRIIPIYPEFGVSEELIRAAQQRLPDRPWLDGVVDFPLLLQYGEDDPIVPVELVRAAVAQKHPQYTRPEQLELITYPQTGHQARAAMFEQAARWFALYV